MHLKQQKDELLEEIEKRKIIERQLTDAKRTLEER
jgi:hypothetical protein